MTSSRASVQQLLTEGWPDPRGWPDAELLAHGRRRLGVYYKFWTLANRARDRGIALISHLREIYEAPNDEELRVTFDRQIRATPYDGSGKLTLPKWGIPPPRNFPPYRLGEETVVLELKYDDRAPMWMYDMVRIFNLQRLAMCKYCACVDGTGLQWGHPARPRHGLGTPGSETGERAAGRRWQCGRGRFRSGDRRRQPAVPCGRSVGHSGLRGPGAR